MSENNNPELLDDGMDFETPRHTGKTLGRLWRSVSDQYKRLALAVRLGLSHQYPRLVLVVRSGLSH